MGKLLYFKEFNCLGDYALYTFSFYYSLFIIATFRAVYVLASFITVSGRRPHIQESSTNPTGLAYDIGIVNDPLDMVDKNIGKFGFKKFIELLEKDPKGFDVEGYIEKEVASIEHLDAGIDEINGFRYIFVRELDFSVQKIEDNKFKEDKCCICMDGYTNGDLVLTLGECPHHFHWDCIKAWLKKSVKCPLCKNCMRRDMLRSVAALQKMMA